MTRTKGFWAALAVISFTGAVLCGYALYDRLSLHISGDMTGIPTAQVSAPREPEGTKEEPVETAAATAEQRPVPEEAKAGSAAPEKEEDSTPQQKKESPEKAPAEKIRLPGFTEALMETPKTVKAVKTHFEYVNASAKKVSLAGSFTKWKETGMARKNGVWQADVYILPGSYRYHLTADGKKVPPPGGSKASTGESIVVVK